jgi:hypothetical protein
MAVYRLFRNKPFEPEAITVMSDAFADVCGALGLDECDAKAMDTVARAVIESAQRGVRGRVHLRKHVLAVLAADRDNAVSRVELSGTPTAVCP